MIPPEASMKLKELKGNNDLDGNGALAGNSSVKLPVFNTDGNDWGNPTALRFNEDFQVHSGVR